MLVRSAIWERKSCGKKKKTQKTVIDVWNVFKRKVEKYVEYLYCYFKQENKNA